MADSSSWARKPEENSTVYRCSNESVEAFVRIFQNEERSNFDIDLFSREIKAFISQERQRKAKQKIKPTINMDALKEMSIGPVLLGALQHLSPTSAMRSLEQIKDTVFRGLIDLRARRGGYSGEEEVKWVPTTAEGLPVSSLSLQGDVMIEDGHESGLVQQENVQFLDEAMGLRVGIDESYDGISGQDQTANTDLSAFLKRPVRIASFTWNESDAIGTTHSYAPWQLYFNDTRIKYKLNNFAFIQCKLKVKVMINASPFYYGAMIGAYIPNPGVTPSTINVDTGTRWFIPLSQRPHMWILPQGSKGDEITLPFFYHKNFLDLQTSVDFANMGTLDFVNYTVLASANGATGVGVSVQVYAWAEDVKLSGPSVGLAMQSDEYGTGVVSAPATAISNAARWFEQIPVIGRFATATRIGASAVSSIASLFGFTNVPNIQDTMPFRQQPFPQLASTSIGYPTEKLTMDPKNELTVDPSVLGLPNTDEMVISSLVQRESYLTTATWSNTNSVDDLLFTSRVSPALYDNDNATQNKVYQVPMCWISQMFKAWRGDIVFRFKFISTPYHKGRCRITFDPSGYAGENIVSDSVSQTVCMTQIVDLGEESDVEIKIPYQQATAFMQARNDLRASQIGWSTSLSPTFPYSNFFDNGTITIRVQTNLTAPVAITSVPILIFVRGAENLEFGNPTDLIPSGGPVTYSYLTPQSDEIYGDPLEMVSGSKSNAHPDRFLINYGESVKSLRLLLRRQSLSILETVPTTTNNFQYYKKRFGRWPVQPGFDANGTESAFGLVTPASTFPYNYSRMVPHTWVAPAFAGQRGSLQWTFNAVSGGQPIGHFRVYRDTTTSSTVNNINSGIVKGVRSVNMAFFQTNVIAGASGSALTNTITQSGLATQLPNYTRFRYQSTRPTYTTALTNLDGSDIDAYGWDLLYTAGQSTSLIVESYVGVGTDFGLYFFVNVPTLWIYSAQPTPNPA